jgi:hypothetical protein
VRDPSGRQLDGERPSELPKEVVDLGCAHVHSGEKTSRAGSADHRRSVMVQHSMNVATRRALRTPRVSTITSHTVALPIAASLHDRYRQAPKWHPSRVHRAVEAVSIRPAVPSDPRSPAPLVRTCTPLSGPAGLTRQISGAVPAAPIDSAGALDRRRIHHGGILRDNAA